MKVSYCDGCRKPTSEAPAQPYKVFVYQPHGNRQVASEEFDFCNTCLEQFLQRLHHRLTPPER